jgi:hypothetical protein
MLKSTTRAHVAVEGGCDVAASVLIANQIIIFYQMGLQPRVLKVEGQAGTR